MTHNRGLERVASAIRSKRLLCDDYLDDIMKEEAIEILKKCMYDAENHPEFLGWGLSDSEIDEIGGDAAMITYDFAYMIKNAIDILEQE